MAGVSQADGQALWRFPFAVATAGEYRNAAVISFSASDGLFLLSVQDFDAVRKNGTEAKGLVVGIKPNSGEELWRSPYLGRRIGAGAAWPGQPFMVSVGAGTVKDSVAALSTRDGSVLWTAKTTQNLLYPPIAAASCVITRGSEASPKALDEESFVVEVRASETGNRLWGWRSRNRHEVLTVSVSEDGQSLICVRNGELCLFDARRGEVLAKVPAPDGRWWGLLQRNSRLYVLTDQGLSCLGYPDLRLQWMIPEKVNLAAEGIVEPGDYFGWAGPYPMSVAHGRVYYLNMARRCLIARECGSGKEVWTYRLPGNTDPRFFIVVGNRLALGQLLRPTDLYTKRMVSWVSLDTEKVIRTQEVAEVARTRVPVGVVSEGTLVVQSKTSVVGLRAPG